MLDPIEQLQEATFSSATTATRQSYPLHRRLFEGRLARYLDRRAFAVLSSTRSNARPHAALTSYVRDGVTFYLPTVEGSLRERNVKGQPYACLTVSEGDHDEHVAVLIEGPVEVLDPAAVPLEVREKIIGDWVATWLVLRAERVLSYAAAGARL